MAYQITDKEEKTVVDVPCDEKLAAQEWALEWVRSTASSEHYVLKYNGTPSAQLFHTVGGQWYLMNN